METGNNSSSDITTPVASTQAENLKRKADDALTYETLKTAASAAAGPQESTTVFSNQLQEAGFSIFHPIGSNGYFTWDPLQGSRSSSSTSTNNTTPMYSSLASIASANDILQHIDYDGKPIRIMPIETFEQSLPKAFEKIDNPPMYENKFPFGEIGIASLHVASKKRGVDLKNNLDFCFGGSTLNILANRGSSGGGNTKKNSIYIACKVPGTNCIFVSNKSSYQKDLSNIGFQFERLVTGGDMADGIKTAEHIHTMKVGDKTVLFRAEVDAMMNSSNDDSPVEIKVSPKTWTTSVMFQMISSGSCTLCEGTSKKMTAPKIPRRGQRGRGGKNNNACSQKLLTSVEFLSLSEVAAKAFKYANVNVLETNIIDAMNVLQAQIVDDGIYKLVYAEDGSSSLILEKLESADDARAYNPFPPSEIVKRLIG